MSDGAVKNLSGNILYLDYIIDYSCDSAKFPSAADFPGGTYYGRIGHDTTQKFMLKHRLVNMKKQMVIIVFFLSLCLSFFPVNEFNGMTGTHWVLGWPVQIAILKKGVIIPGDTRQWHIDIDYLSALLNVTIWTATLTGCLYLYLKIKSLSK